jgi:hypothetical protein
MQWRIWLWGFSFFIFIDWIMLFEIFSKVPDKRISTINGVIFAFYTFTAIYFFVRWFVAIPFLIKGGIQMYSRGKKIFDSPQLSSISPSSYEPEQPTWTMIRSYPHGPNFYWAWSMPHPGIEKFRVGGSGKWSPQEEK